MNSERPRVLVVDDEPNILKTIVISLEAIGFECSPYARPQDAVEALRVTEFDLAFIDLKMTPIDGMQLLDEIMSASASTTVVMMTAHGSIDSAAKNAN